MRIMGRLEQDGGVSTIDETLIFATKVQNSKNFYVGLAGGIFGGSLYGYAVPYSGRLQSVVAAVRNPVAAPITVELRCLRTGTTFWTDEIPAGQASIYLRAGLIELPEETYMGCYLACAVNFSDPVIRVVVSKKSTGVAV